jgi:hypothetical protein
MVPPAWPASLVATIPLMGVTWRVYATSCTGLWTVAGKCGNNAGQRGLGAPSWVRHKAPKKGDPSWH